MKFPTCNILLGAKFPNSPKKLINMLCYLQHNGWNYFQAEGKKLLKKLFLHMSSTSNTFQRKYENFD